MPANARRWFSLRTWRSAASIFCLTLCVGFLLLGVRSYWWRDELSKFEPESFTHLVSYKGGLLYSMVDIPLRSSVPWTLRSQTTAVWFEKYGIKRHWSLEFEWRRGARGLEIAKAPHWILVTVVGAAAFALKPKPRYRFSLFNFLAFTTFAAMLAALAAWLVRLRD
jgi:hypothetical protein